jgi:inosine-uridine nucleoside N-ribohydrolase
LRAPWKKIICTTVDISVKTHLTQGLIDRIKAGTSPSANYIGKYARLYGENNYLWDELASASWLDPTIITKTETRYLDVDLSRGAGYGNILTWTGDDRPKVEVQPVEVQVDLDTDKFYKMFVDLLTAPTPHASVVGGQ